MTFHFHRALACLLFAASSASAAGWVGFPCPTNTTWHAVQTNHYISQLFSGLVERCWAVNVAPPVLIDTLTCYGGWTNGVEDVGYYTNELVWICDPPSMLPEDPGWEEWMSGCWQYNENVFVHQYYATNPIVVYTNIVVTNQFSPFAYSWSTPDSSGVATSYPPIRASWFSAWDSKLEDVLLGKTDNRFLNDAVFLGTNAYGDAWYEANTNAFQSPPKYASNLSDFLYEAGIGGTYSNSPGDYGNRFTHKPNLATNTWVLGVISHSTNGWRYNRTGDLSVNVYDLSVRPYLQYVPAGTNAFTNSIVFTTANAPFLATKRLVGLTETLQDCTESFTVSGPGLVASTNRLAVVANMTASNAPPNMDDAWRVVYLTGFPVFGETVYRLYPCDINERQQALNRLTMTTGRGLLGYARNYIGSAISNTLDDAKAAALSAYALGGSFDGSYNATRYSSGGTPPYTFIVNGLSVTNKLNLSVSAGASNKTMRAVHYTRMTTLGIANFTFNPWGKVKLADGASFPLDIYAAIMEEDIVNFKFSSAWQISETNKTTLSSAYVTPPDDNALYYTGYYLLGGSGDGYNTYDHKTWMTYY